MPVLPNPKHEAFAQGLAKGRTQAEAYADAGFKPNDGHAARLAGNGMVSARVRELQEKTAAMAEIDIMSTLREMVRIGHSDLRRAFDKDGRVKPPKDWDDDFAAAVSSVEATTTVKDDKAETVYKIKLGDKNSAIEKIAKHLGMFIERSEVTVTHVYHEMSDDELDRELQNQFLTDKSNAVQTSH